MLFRSSRVDIPENNNENNFFSWGRKSKNVKTLLLKNYYTKYSKHPHDLSKILNSDFGLFYSQNYMFMLNQYCVSNNIKLIWTFLEIDYLNSLNNLCVNKKFYNNYIDLNISKWEYDKKNKKIVRSDLFNCHEDEKNYYFDFAADRENGLENSHWGYHINIHIAEDLYKYMKESVYI